MLLSLLNRPVPPSPAVLDPLEHALAVEDVHHGHDGRICDRAVIPQPLPYLTHHARALGGPHHVHDGHLKLTELAHLAAPPCIHVSTECGLPAVPRLARRRKADPGVGLFAPPRNFSRHGTPGATHALAGTLGRCARPGRGGGRRDAAPTTAGDTARP